MKKILSALLCLTVALSCFSFGFGASDFVTIASNTDATVVQVLDGDAIVVRLPNGDSALVRFIGVDTMGNNAAYEYLTKELMGANVHLVADYAVGAPVDRWNKMYVYKNNQLINSKLLVSGFGKINPEDANASLYRNLLRDESDARYAQTGVWNEGYGSGVYVYGGDKVNINTATYEQLREVLKTTNNTLPNNIVKYRDRHPFETVSEIKFVSGMTKEIYSGAYMKLTVSTNIRTASVTELAALKGVTTNMAQAIVNYRTKYRFSNLTELYTEDLISRNTYDLNKPFIALSNEGRISYAIPDYTVNVVTATQAQLEMAGLTSTQAKRIIENRTDYNIKSLYDLKDLDNMNFTDLNINYLADNLHIYTELNTATEYELRSVFGSSFDRATFDDILDNRPYSSVSSLQYYIKYDYYNRLSPYLYVDRPETDCVNLNTATTSQLMSAGFSQSQAASISARQGKMLSAKDIPVNVSGKNVSLFTNINTASARELESLGYMNSDLINQIIIYRNDQPFGSVDEIEEFFLSQGRYSVFNMIKNFIVVR